MLRCDHCISDVTNLYHDINTQTYNVRFCLDTQQACHNIHDVCKLKLRIRTYLSCSPKDIHLKGWSCHVLWWIKRLKNVQKKKGYTRNDKHAIASE